MHWINLMSVASKIKSPFAWFDFKYIIRLPSFTLHWPDVYMSWYAGNKCNFDSHICLKSWIKIEHSSLMPERYGQKWLDTVRRANWIVKCQHIDDFKNFSLRINNFSNQFLKSLISSESLGRIIGPESIRTEWYGPFRLNRNRTWTTSNKNVLFLCHLVQTHFPYDVSHIWYGPYVVTFVINGPYNMVHNGQNRNFP